MNRNLKLILLILIVSILTSVNYRMFFARFDYHSIIEHKVVMIENPEYRNGGVRGTPYWCFKSVNQTFQLQNEIEINITKKEILQIKKGDSLSLFSYNYYSVFSLIDFLNGRTSIFGLKGKKFNKYNPIIIQKQIREMDVKGFWGLNIFSIVIIGVMYSNWLIQKLKIAYTLLVKNPKS